MIDIHFTLTEAEYLEAQKLYTSSNKSWKRVRVILIVILLLSVTVVLLSLPNGKGAEVIQQLRPLAVIAIFLSLLPLWKKWGFKKRFLTERQNLTNVNLIIDDSGYRANIPGIGEGVAEWGGMDGWQEGKSVIVLRSGLLMRLFPKAPLREAQIDEVRKLLTRKLGPVGVMRKH